MNIKFTKTLVFPFLIFITLIFVTSLPYLLATKNCLPGNHFAGQIEYMPDQQMYFSFINQAHAGKLLFNNKLTYMTNGNVFVNVQFALIGYIQRIFQLSSNWTYEIWRILGIFSLVFSFYWLTILLFKNPKKQILALFLFCFGGGFSFIFLALFKLGIIDRNVLFLFSIDVWSGILPFQQMMTNPHFSFPHGIFLLGMVLYLVADNKISLPLFILSGVVFAVQGFIRPYDLISLLAVISAFVIIEILVMGFDRRIAIFRLVPLVIIIPALLYNIWLFKFNEIFKYWSLQGHNAGVDPILPFQYFAYGITGLLVLLRIWFVKVQPLTKMDRFLGCWLAIVFILTQIGKICPLLGFSPQLAVPLFGPLVLFGIGIQPSLLRFKQNIVKLSSFFLIILTVLYAISTTFYFSQRFLKSNTTNHIFYESSNEIAAYKWIEKNIASGNVVLALPDNALKITKYTNVQVPAAHYSVTPKFSETVAEVNKFYENKTSLTTKMEILKLFNVDYVYVGPQESKELGNIDLLGMLGKVVFENKTITIVQVFKHD